MVRRETSRRDHPTVGDADLRRSLRTRLQLTHGPMADGHSDCWEDRVEQSGKELTCREFAELLRSRKAHYPISDRYISEIHDSPDKSGEDEREHMIIWFESNETSGSGSYSRKTPNGSARTCYGRLCNAASLLWIAEAVGVPKATVQRAFEAAETAGDYRSACGRIRKVIPWDEILVRANLLMSKRETPTRLPRLLKLVPKWAHRKKGD